MNMGLLLLIVLTLFVAGTIPQWSYSKNWSYGPSSGFALGAIAVIALMAMGRL